MPRNVSSISDFGFRISDFRPSRQRSVRRDKGALNGGVWHPDSHRIGVPGILSGSATIEGLLELRSAGQEPGHGGWR